MPGAEDNGPVSGEEYEEEQSQEIAGNMDLAHCWRVIAQQSTMIQAQQSLLQSMSEDIKSLRQEMATMTPKQDQDESKLSVADVVKILDKRGTPPPVPFDVNSGASFDAFFEQFEKYCQSKYEPSTYEQWTGELASYLRGEILQIFKIWGGANKKLSELKIKLKEFCKAEVGKDLSSRILSFSSASPEPGELLHVYAYRLEHLYGAAHPGTEIENNIELQTRLLSTLPEGCRIEIQKEMDQQKNILDKEIIPWSKIIMMLKRYQERNAKEIKSGALKVKNDPIWFTSTNVYNPSHVNQIQSQNQFEQPRGRQRQSQPRQFRSRSFSRGPQRNQPNANHGNFRNYVYNNNNSNNHPSHGNPTNNSNNFYGNFKNFNKFPRPVCGFCGITGHEQKVCWRRLGCCVRCGSSDHYAKDCQQPRRRNNYNNPSNNQMNGQTRNNQASGQYHTRAQSLDRQNYLMNTPLNPFSPSWDPQANAGAQGAAIYNPASLNL